LRRGHRSHILPFRGIDSESNALAWVKV
jgi:hypothetical protein